MTRPAAVGATRPASRRWLTGAEIMERFGMSRCAFHRLRKASGFPAPIRAAGMRPRWLIEEVETWERRSLEDRGATS